MSYYPCAVVSQNGGEVTDAHGLKWSSIGCLDHGSEFVEVVINDTGDYLAIVPHETMEVIIVSGPGGPDAPAPGDEDLFSEAIKLYQSILVEPCG